MVFRNKFIYFFCLLLCVVSHCVFTSPRGDNYTDARLIAKEYWEGVVKILIYDPFIEKKFHLDSGDGYLTRGSGFIVLPEGIVFTNRHVIEWCVYGYMVADWEDEEGVMHHSDVLTYKPGLESRAGMKKIYYIGHAIPYIQVFTEERGGSYELYLAEVLNFGEAFDGAMLRIISKHNGEPVNKTFRALPLGNSDHLELGEGLAVLGYPSQYQKSGFSLDLKDTLTMSYGMASGWDYVFDDIYGFIKTNAAVHEGNSGGPVFGDDEKVIGIATAMGLRTKIGLVEGINGMYYVAQPQKKIFQELVRNGLNRPKVPKRFLSLSGKPRPLPDLSKKLSDVKELTGVAPHSLVLKGVVQNSTDAVIIEGVSLSVLIKDKKSGQFVPFSSAKSDSRGAFVFPRSFPLGRTYRLTVKKDSYLNLQQEISLGNKDQEYLKIRLIPIRDGMKIKKKL